MQQKWWKESVVYQVYPRSFMDSNGDGIGDIQGIIQKLDYLRNLGIDVIWICPMYKSPNDDNGYDISDYQDIMEEFGRMEDFNELLEEVHIRDMKLIMDLVINHTSDEHPWFIESSSSKENSKRDWYIWQKGKNGHPPNNWESIFGGSIWEYDEKTEEYYMHLFSKRQPDLNWENPKVRNALYNMVNWWLDKGIDGFRIDAISHIKRQPGFPNMPNSEKLDVVPAAKYTTNVKGIENFLSEFSDKTIKNYDVMTVGEAGGVSVEDSEFWVSEDNGCFDMIFQFDHVDLWDKGTQNNKDILGFKQALTKWQEGLQGKGWNALFLENHDLPRSVSCWGDEEHYWNESSKMLATVYFLMQGTPFIYQGQEIGMTNVKFDNIEDYNDVGMLNYYKLKKQEGRSHEDLMEVVWSKCRDNSRTPMQWNSDDNAGFSTSKSTWLKLNQNYVSINVDAQMEEGNSILNYYKDLIQLRKKHKLFVYGSYQLLLPDHPEIFAYLRDFEGQKGLIICNMTDRKTDFELPSDLNLHQASLELTNYSKKQTTLKKNMTFEPFESCVYMFNK
ncbi:glycoside hydrolase family 13 protein [Halobacillus aidingensis]|uniref:Alpha-glucosidase n=1 Tax=Halobacillus aidingensis TaxID=240303 RepID=A0A1H0QQH8_HALAD|nr:alpha-glucosidase [Halobacillus aidingensis]SDP18989.1 alpha-glucosidase [Halobacillus aidingensis]